MKVVKRALWVMALAFGGGCAAEAVPTQSEPAIAQVEQAISVFDCQAELAQCVRQARGVLALAQCTTSFATWSFRSCRCERCG